MPKITLESGEVVELSQESYDALANAVQKPKRWKPRVDEDYYYVDSFSDIEIGSTSGDRMDEFCYAQRNMFRTKREAQKYLEYLETVAEYRDLIEKLNEGWTPDWSDYGQFKYYINFNHTNLKPNIYSSLYIQEKENWHYMKSREVVQEVIKTLGEDKVTLVIKGM